MGRMISQIATAIRGKNSPHFRNSQADVKNGDVCVIVNAADPLLTGKKLLFKDLKYHTGFVGHLRTHSYKHVLNKKPELLVWKFFLSSITISCESRCLRTKLAESTCKTWKFSEGQPTTSRTYPNLLLTETFTSIFLKPTCKSTSVSTLKSDCFHNRNLASPKVLIIKNDRTIWSWLRLREITRAKTQVTRTIQCWSWRHQQIA